MIKHYLQGPVCVELFETVFAIILIYGLFCESLPFAKATTQGVKHVTKILQDYVRHSHRDPLSGFCGVLNVVRASYQYLALWYLVQTVCTG